MGRTKDLYIKIQDDIISSGDQAFEGEITFLDAVIRMHEHKRELNDTLTIIKEWEDENREIIENEALKHDKNYMGHTFEIRQGRKMHSFSHIPEWQHASKTVKDIEYKGKAMLELFIKGGFDDYDEESREDIKKQLPEVSYGKSSLIVKPPK